MELCHGLSKRWRRGSSKKEVQEGKGACVHAEAVKVLCSRINSILKHYVLIKKEAMVKKFRLSTYFPNKVCQSAPFLPIPWPIIIFH